MKLAPGIIAAKPIIHVAIRKALNTLGMQINKFQYSR